MEEENIEESNEEEDEEDLPEEIDKYPREDLNRGEQIGGMNQNIVRKLLL